MLLLVSVQQLESSNGDEPDCWSDGADTTTCCGSVLGGSWLGDGTGGKPCGSSMLSVVASACVFSDVPLLKLVPSRLLSFR